MIIPISTLIMTLAAWGINKAAPAVFHATTDPMRAQIKQAEDLCKNHGDCEAEKIQSLQGMKPVVRLEATPLPDLAAPTPDAPPPIEITPVEGQ